MESTEQKNNEISEFVCQTIKNADLKKIASKPKTDIWTNRINILVNLVPYTGGAIAQLINYYHDYRECEFLRKFATYIFELADTTIEDRCNFCDEIENKAKDFSGSVIMGMVDRLDNINKQLVLANLTKAKIRNEINIQDFFPINNAGTYSLC